MTPRETEEKEICQWKSHLQELRSERARRLYVTSFHTSVLSRQLGDNRNQISYGPQLCSS